MGNILTARRAARKVVAEIPTLTCPRSNFMETIRLLPVRQSVPFPARPQFSFSSKASLDELASLNLEIIRRHRQTLGLSLAVKGFLRTYSRIWLRVLLAPFSKLSNSNFPPSHKRNEYGHYADRNLSLYLGRQNQYLSRSMTVNHASIGT